MDSQRGGFEGTRHSHGLKPTVLWKMDDGGQLKHVFRQWVHMVFTWGMAYLFVSPIGCSRIAVAPSCPAELTIGQSGPIDAHESQAGAIPTYQWEAIPPEAGAFDAAAAASTRFLALQAGAVTLRLTASDGLFQVVDECRITVIAVAAPPPVPPPPPDTGGGRPPRR